MNATCAIGAQRPTTASRAPIAGTRCDVTNELYDVMFRALPFLGSAFVFAAIAFLTWAQTPREIWDSLTFTLVFFLIPWAFYALWVGIGFLFHWTPPSWVYTANR